MDSVCPNNIEEVKILVKKHGFEPGSESQNRKLLEEGLDTIRKRIEYNRQLSEAGNINLDVTSMGGWVHNLVRDTLGGRINSEKQTIFWDIKNQVVEFNPFTGKVEYAS